MSKCVTEESPVYECLGCGRMFSLIESRGIVCCPNCGTGRHAMKTNVTIAAAKEIMEADDE